MKKILCIACVCITINVTAQKPIAFETLKDHINDSVTVTGKVFGGKYIKSDPGAPTFLNIGSNGPGALLTLLIWDNVRMQFPEAPEQYYKGKDVTINGKIILYNGKPEIIIYSAAQMKIAD